MHRANNEEAEEERERIFAAYRILRAAASNEQEPQAYFRGRGLKLMPKNACVLSAAKSGKLTTDDSRLSPFRSSTMKACLVRTSRS
jgi:hypothetical protein